MTIVSKEDPRPEPFAELDLSQPLDVLDFLLRENMRRFMVGVQMEKARGIIFPECSVILRDSMRLLFEIQRRKTGEPTDFETLIEGLK